MGISSVAKERQQKGWAKGERDTERLRTTGREGRERGGQRR